MPETKHINFEGVDHEFPADFSDQDISKALGLYHKPYIPNPSSDQPPVGYIPPVSKGSHQIDISKSSGTLPKGVTVPHYTPEEEYNSVLKSLPVIGGMLGGIPGAGAGAFGEQALTTNKPSLGEGSLDTLLQGVLPSLFAKGVSKVVSGNLLQSLAKKMVTNSNPTVAKTLGETAQSFTSPETSTIETAGELFRKNPNLTDPQIYQASQTELPNKMMSVPFKPGEGQFGQFSEQDFNDVAKKALSDVQQVRNWKLATGDNTTIENLALNKVMGKGYSAGTGKLDADKILTELTGPSKEIYNEAIRPETAERLTDFLQKAKSFEPPEGQHPLIQYAKKRLIFELPIALGVHHVTGGAGGVAAGAGALYLTDKAITTLSQSEAMGRLALRALEVPAGSEEGKFVGQLLLRGLAGSPAIFKGPDGKEEKVIIGPDGQPQLPQPTH